MPAALVVVSGGGEQVGTVLLPDAPQLGQLRVRARQVALRSEPRNLLLALELHKLLRSGVGEHHFLVSVRGFLIQYFDR